MSKKFSFSFPMPPPPPAAAAASAVKEDELDNKRKRVYFTEAAFSFPNKADAYGAPASFSGGESPKNKPKLEWNSRPALFTLTGFPLIFFFFFLFFFHFFNCSYFPSAHQLSHCAAPGRRRRHAFRMLQPRFSHHQRHNPSN